MSQNFSYLGRVRTGEELALHEILIMIIQLSLPAIMAQLSSIIMQYIDASMVGHLGAEASAAIGLMSSSTWLFSGLCTASGIGFTVQIANRIGGNDEPGARRIVKIGLLCAISVSIILCAIGIIWSIKMPFWLGAEGDLLSDARIYFLVFALSIPFIHLNQTAAGMIQCSGNMKIPGFLEVQMCGLDVIFNVLFIFSTGTFVIPGIQFSIPGAGLGVMGAALGTAASQVVTAFLMLWYLLFCSEKLGLFRVQCGLSDKKDSHWQKSNKNTAGQSELKSDLSTEIRTRSILSQWLKISVPVCIEQFVTSLAYIMITKIISPLGTIAIAANSFAITAESFCYMPGYGISSAATTIIGQCLGARRPELSRKVSWMITAFGMLVMTCTGCLMYMIAPNMIGFLTEDVAICTLGTKILRIEAFAEPLFAASIVITGVFRGRGSTYFTTILIFISMWLIRIPCSAFFAGRYALPGVWTAICVELCIRGILFLALLSRLKWDETAKA